MKLKNSCTLKQDRKLLGIEIVRLLCGMAILYFFHPVLSGIFFLYWLFLYLVIDNLKCKACIYKKQEECASLDDYCKNYKNKFNNYAKIAFPFLIIDWFFAFGMGIYLMITGAVSLAVMIPLTAIHLALTLFIMGYIKKKYCPECCCNEFCFYYNL